jgi:hypothetical protein
MGDNEIAELIRSLSFGFTMHRLKLETNAVGSPVEENRKSAAAEGHSGPLHDLLATDVPIKNMES